MSKASLFKVFSFLGVLMCFNQPTLFARNEVPFDVIIKIVPEVADKESCIVEVVKNGKATVKVAVPINEDYKISLDFFNKYSLNLKYPGHLIRIIHISTEIPKDVWQRDPVFPPFPMIVSLVKRTAENAESEINKPTVAIAYVRETDNFGKVVLGK